MKNKVIFATKNKGKIKEINMILKDLGLEVISMGEAGIHIDVIEDGTTFEENAIKKAKEVMEATGQIVMSDDSGLEIDYLDKAPGVYSARYLGENTPYDEKNTIILKKLEGVPEEKRTARFVCVVAAAFPDGKVITTRGVIEGRIGYTQQGDNGFGYDPIFFVPEYNCTTAEMESSLKNKISHRGQALTKMKEQMISILDKQEEK